MTLLLFAGALDPQQASSASEELKAALLEQGVLRALAELAADFATACLLRLKGTLQVQPINVHMPSCLLGIPVQRAESSAIPYLVQTMVQGAESFTA